MCKPSSVASRLRWSRTRVPALVTDIARPLPYVHFVFALVLYSSEQVWTNVKAAYFPPLLNMIAIHYARPRPCNIPITMVAMCINNHAHKTIVQKQ